jgi:hypothetical protein
MNALTTLANHYLLHIVGFNYSADISFNLALLNGITEQSSQPYFECPEPATRCSWDKLATLAVCSDYQDVTDNVIQNCTGTGNVSVPSLYCSYTFPEWELGVAYPDLSQPIRRS